MEVFIAIGAAQAFYLYFLFIIKEKKQYADYIMAIFLLVLSLIYTIVYISYEYEHPNLQVLLWNFGSLIAPFVYLYAKQIQENHHRLNAKYILFFIPWSLSTIYLFWLLFSFSDRELVLLFNNANFLSKPILYLFFHVFDLLIIPIYSILIFRIIKIHKLKISNNFSYSENIDLQWMKNFTIAILFMFVAIYGIYIYSNYSSISEFDASKYSFAISIFAIYYIGYHGLRQKNINLQMNNEKSIDEDKNSTEVKKYEKTGLSKEKSQELLQTINQFMIDEKPYLENKLSIGQLSSLIDISVHHISQILNETAKMSYFEYINSYRIDEFLKKIENNEHQKYTLVGIASDCGFNSKSSFNRVFKQIKGISPSQYIKMN